MFFVSKQFFLQDDKETHTTVMKKKKSWLSFFKSGASQEFIVQYLCLQRMNRQVYFFFPHRPIEH